MSDEIRHPGLTVTRRTICEVHRELHDIVFEYIQDEDIRRLALQKVTDVSHMARRMDKKLKEYAYYMAGKEWRGWDRVGPYRALIKFYRTMRRRGLMIKDPYRLEAEDLKNGIVRDPREPPVPVEDVWPEEAKKWQ